ncbi:hypothetical protein C8R43DRAFT_1195110 [Mycena crocata]|nr:hypothetical protein C8R43DRAFT_1195110 [Mycena crocata]
MSTTQPLSSISAPATLAVARANLALANTALARAPHDPAALAAAAAARQAALTASAAADSLARPVITTLLQYHLVQVPSPMVLDRLVDTLNDPSFAPLAQIAGEYYRWSDALPLALRRAWRRHHQRPVESTARLPSSELPRFLACTTFGAVAFMLEDEYAVDDRAFIDGRHWYWALRERRADTIDPLPQLKNLTQPRPSKAPLPTPLLSLSLFTPLPQSCLALAVCHPLTIFLLTFPSLSPISNLRLPHSPLPAHFTIPIPSSSTAHTIPIFTAASALQSRPHSPFVLVPNDTIYNVHEATVRDLNPNFYTDEQSQPETAGTTTHEWQ